MRGSSQGKVPRVPVTQVSIRTLGGLRVEIDQSPIALPKSKKARALFAYVAHARGPISRQRLAEIFFSEVADPRGGLRWSLSRLRAVIATDCWQTDATVVALDPAVVSLDVTRLEQATIDSALGDVADFGVDDFDGGFLTDLMLPNIPEFEAWRVAREAKYIGLQEELLHACVAAHLGQPQATEFARLLVDLDPTSEAHWAHLVRSLVATGRREEGLKMARVARTQLRREAVSLTRLIDEALGASESIVLNTVGIKAPSLAVGLSGQIDDQVGAELTSAIYRAAACNKAVSATMQPFTARLNGQNELAEAARESDVGYLLNAIVREGVENLHVTLELLDTSNTNSIFVWRRQLARSDLVAEMERFEAYLSARFELDVPLAFIGIAQQRPVALQGPRDAYYLAMLELFGVEGFDPQAAVAPLSKLVDQYPNFATAASMLALVRMFSPELNQAGKQIEQTISLARSAATIEQDDCFVLGICAMVMGHLGATARPGLGLAERALSVNPHSVIANLSAAHNSIYLGQHDDAQDYLDRVEQAGDVYPLAFFYGTARAMLCYQMRHYEDALRWAEEAHSHSPTYVVAIRYAIASLGQLGRVDEARGYVQRALALDRSENINYFLEHSVYDIQQATDHLVDGLRKGALPESTMPEMV